MTAHVAELYSESHRELALDLQREDWKSGDRRPWSIKRQRRADARAVPLASPVGCVLIVGYGLLRVTGALPIR